MQTIRLRKRSGFTLIEIIIVVVILGILASIAMPKLVENIDKARATEAFSMGASYAKAVNRCLDDETGGSSAITVNGTHMTNCSTYSGIGMTTPAQTDSFDYTVVPPAAGTPTGGNVFTARGRFSGSTTADTVSLTVKGDGTVTKACGGKFAKMCKS